MMNSTLKCKGEPVSPFSNEEAAWSSDGDVELYWTDDLLNANLFNHDKSELVTKILENLDQLEDLNKYIEEDAYTDFWLEDKPLNLFEDKPLNLFEDNVAISVSNDTIKSTTSNYLSTQNLLSEFNTVFDSVNSALTPPQSPINEPPILSTLEPASTIYTSPHDHTYPVLINSFEPNVKIGYITLSQAADVAHELAVVDELVRSRVEILVPSSPSESCSSNFDESSDDPEWDTSSTVSNNKKKKQHVRSKPYSRNNDDKKSRKKEQNKNAATRYRMKKKAEVDVVLEEEKLLQDKNSQLDVNVADLKREIGYLKGLMRDLFKAKGLIK